MKFGRIDLRTNIKRANLIWSSDHTKKFFLRPQTKLIFKTTFYFDHIFQDNVVTAFNLFHYTQID